MHQAERASLGEKPQARVKEQSEPQLSGLYQSWHCKQKVNTGTSPTRSLNKWNNRTEILVMRERSVLQCWLTWEYVGQWHHGWDQFQFSQFRKQTEISNWNSNFPHWNWPQPWVTSQERHGLWDPTHRGGRWASPDQRNVLVPLVPPEQRRLVPEKGERRSELNKHSLSPKKCHLSNHDDYMSQLALL